MLAVDGDDDDDDNDVYIPKHKPGLPINIFIVLDDDDDDCTMLFGGGVIWSVDG